MSIPRGQSVEDLCAFVTGLSLWQTFLFSLWVLSLLLQKLADAASLPLWQWFVESLVSDESGSFGRSSAGDDCSRSFSNGDVDGELADDELICCDLIPSLPDQVVKEKVWPILVRSPSALKLLRLRHVSKQWNCFVGTTLKWNALNFILLDSSGCWKTTAHGGLDSFVPTQRLRFEMANYQFLLSEDMREIEARVRFSRFRLVRAVPFYVSIEGCPPDVEESPKYYGL